MAPRGESGVGDKADRFAEKFWKESEKPAGIRPLQDEVASRYKEVVRREQALAARERLASEVCQAQEEREQDLEEFAERLKAQQEVLLKREGSLAKEKHAQEAAARELAAKAGTEARQGSDEVTGLRLSERAGKLASREKRVAEDEAALLRREQELAEKEARIAECEHDVMEAESRNMRELAARRRQAEMRELRVADLESRLAEAQATRPDAGVTRLLPRDADISRPSLGRPSVGRPSVGRPSIGWPSSDSGPRASLAEPSLQPCELKMEAPVQEVQASVEFQDAHGGTVTFKLNGRGGVDFYVDGKEELCDVDCFARGRILHVAGTTGTWSPAKQAIVPEGQEELLQRVLALFHQKSPSASREEPRARLDTEKLEKSTEARSTPSETSLVGPGEELTLMEGAEIEASQAEAAVEKAGDKVVRFDRSAPLAPPVSWERPSPDESNEESSRPRLTARKRVQEAQPEPDTKWYSALRRLTRCG